MDELKKIGTCFVHPHTLFYQVEQILKKVGAEDFFKSPEESVKKAREGFAAYFFILAMKVYTKRDWWLAQPDQSDRAYPDFDFISFSENPEDLKMEPVELVGIYPHFNSFDQVVEVIENKKRKYGVQPVKFSLLIFVNHEKSEDWIENLKTLIITEAPFISIWTIHLKFKPGGEEVHFAIAQKIVPKPQLRIEANMYDPSINKKQPMPSSMEERINNGLTYITFKQEFIDKVKKYNDAKKRL